MFQVERLVEECKSALRESTARKAVREIVARAVATPSEVIAALGEPRLAGVQTLYHADDLTVLNIGFGPHMRFLPHDHRMWAVIGIYGGQEHNVFYRRDGNGLEEAGTKDLETGDTVALGEQVIHAVINPLAKVTAAIHVYGGDFFETPRSEWDPETLEESPYDIEKNMRLFEEANERLRAGAQAG